MPIPIQIFEIEDKKFTIIDISDEIENDKKSASKLSSEEKLRIFEEKIPNIDSFKNLKNEGFLEEIEHYIWNFEDEIFSIMIYADTFPCLHIEDIYIEAEFRGAGIGSILLNYIETIAKENHFRCIIIYAISNYPTIKFWRANGFSPSSKIDKEYFIPLLEKLDDNISIAIDSDPDYRHIIPMIKIYHGTENCPTGIWKFTNDAINSMQKLVDETEKLEVEQGAVLEGQLLENQSKGKIELGEICIGEMCSVPLTGKASPDKIFIGEFHTHVLDEDEDDQEIMMSDDDIVRMDKIIKGISCIGGRAVIKGKLVNRNERIKCFMHKPGQLTEDRINKRFEELSYIENNMPFSQIYSEWKKIIKRDFIEFNPYDCLE
jgi:GNAT superfamily N-acetyltransferase